MTEKTNLSTALPINTVITGDSLTELKKLPDKSVDLILADLPYGTTDCAWDKCLPIDELWAEYKRLITPSAAILLFAQQPFATRLINVAGRMFRYQIVWEKNKSVGFLNTNKMPLRAHELILVFYNRLPTYNPQMSPGKPYVSKDRQRGKSSVYRANRRPGKENTGFRYPRDVIKFPQPSSAEGRYHPTQKPLALLEYLIKTYSNPGDLVLDNTCGSGSALVAALNTGRNYIGIELDKTFVEAARLRLAAAGERLTCPA